MFHAVIFVTICDILCCLHGFSDALPGHHPSVKRSSDLSTSHRSFHQADRAQAFDSGDDQQPVSHGRVSTEHKIVPGGRGLFSDLLESAGGVALSALKTGHKLILPPLEGIEWITGQVTDVLSLNKGLLESIAGTAKDAWEHVEAIEFPGKSIVALVFPKGIVAVADKLTNNVIHFATETKAAVEATVAYSLYATLSVIFPAVTTAIKTLGFACIPLNKTSLEPNIGLVNTVEISGGTICGLDTLHPKNNVTITKEDGKFMVLTLPWVLENLVVKIESVDVSGWMGSLIKDQPVETTVQEIACQATISLQKGTFLKFLNLHLELGEITGIIVRMEGATEEGETAAEVINGWAGALGAVVRNLVNEKLLEMEKQLSEYLLGNSSRK